VKARNRELEDIISDNARFRIEAERAKDEIGRLHNLLNETRSPVTALIGYQWDSRHPDTNQLFIMHAKQKVELDQLMFRYESKDHESAALRNEITVLTTERDRL
jgi:hypothetical protein